MASVDDAGRSRAQVDACDLAGDEPVCPRVRDEVLVGASDLVGQAPPAPSRVPERPHEHRGEQRGAHGMPHRVGDRQVQRVTFHREVERVAGHIAGWLQPPRQGELTPLAREGLGQQPVLDLCGQRQPDRPPSPLVQICEAPVGDDEVAQGASRVGDNGLRHLVGRRGQRHLEHTDSVAAVGHRRHDAHLSLPVVDLRCSGARAPDLAPIPPAAPSGRSPDPAAGRRRPQRHDQGARGRDRCSRR